MTTIYVAQPFTLKLDNGAQRSFAAGEQEVEEAMAAHWYVQAHCTPKPVATPEPVRLTEPVSEAERAHAQNSEQTQTHIQKSGKKAKP